jgi:hypothetical protein
MSLANIYKTLCDGLGLPPVNGSYVQALGNYFQVADVPGRNYEDEVLVASLINSGGPGTASVELHDSFSDFPAIGSSEVIYVAEDSNLIYRYDNILSNYVLLNDPNTPTNTPQEGNLFFVDIATTYQLNTCTYSNGPGNTGTGATLTATVNGLLSQADSAGIDGVTPSSATTYILVKDQVNKLHNGPYFITQLGSVSTPFILTRVDDMDSTSEIYPSSVIVGQGTVNAAKQYYQTTVDPVIGTSQINYVLGYPAPQVLPITSVHSILPDALNATYTNGTLYPSTLPAYFATLVSNINGSINTLNTEGSTIVAGHRVLVTGMADPIENGDYLVVSKGSATTPWRLRRIGYNASTLSPKNKGWIVEGEDSNVRGSIYYINEYDLVDTAIGVSQDLVFTKVNSTERKYLRYIAELNQTGTANPTANVLVNELGGTVVWTRDGGVSDGFYNATLNGAFAGKVQIIPPTNSYGFASSEFDVYGAGKTDNNSIYLWTGKQDIATGTATASDDCLYTDYSFIEIRVFI